MNKAVELNVEWGYHSDSWTYWRRALHFSRKKEYRKCIQDCCTALGFMVEPRFIHTEFDLHVMRGFCFGEMGEYALGITDCTKALDMEVSGGGFYGRREVYIIRGTLYKRSEQYDKAREDFQKVIELNPDDEEALELLASL